MNKFLSIILLTVIIGCNLSAHNFNTSLTPKTEADCVTITEADSLTSGLVGYWSFDDGTANDDSGNGHNGTIHGSVPFTDWDNGKYITFDGNYNNYVQIPHHSDLNFSGSFSICAWINKLGDGTGSAHVISKGRDMLSDYYICAGGRIFSFRYYDTWGAPNSTVNIDDSIFTLNEWHYVSCVVDTASMMTNYYLDGVLMDQDTIDQSFNITTTYPLIFGRHFTSSSGGSSYPYPSNVSLDEVRIYNRALSVSEVLELGGFTGSSTLNDSLVAYYPFNANANDESGNNNNGTVNGATLTTDRFGNANSAYDFDGNDFVDCGNSPSLNWQNSDFSVSVWVKRNSQGIQYSTHQVFVGKQLDGGNYRGWYFRYDPSDSVWFSANYDAYPWVGNGSIYSTNSILDTNWHHYVGIMDGQDSLVSLYIDGVLDNMDSDSDNYNIDNASDLFIGRKSNGEYFYGKIDDIRIYNRAITSSEVDSLFHENNWDNIISNFIASDTTITLGDTIQFTDLSTGSPTSWLWYFGDGSTDTIQNPVHIYQNTGTYTVSLVVSDGVNSDTLTLVDYIDVEPSINYFVNEVQNLDNNIVPTNWSLVVHNPVGGLFNGQLEAQPVDAHISLNRTGVIPSNITDLILEWDGVIDYSYWGQSTAIKVFFGTSYLTCFTMNADYNLNGNNYAIAYYNGNSGNYSPLFQLNPAYAYDELAHTARFTNDSILFSATSNLNGSEIFNIAFPINDSINFQVRDIDSIYFTAYTTTGCISWLDNIEITLNESNPLLIASFTASDTTITLGDTIQFTDLSTGSQTSWLWDFGDGSTDTVQNPVHIYQNTGTYTVSLVVSDSVNSDTLTKVDYIMVSLVPQFIALSTGWNISSFYVTPQYTLMDSIFNPLIVNTSLTKVIDEAGGFMQEIPGFGWMNTIGNMANTEGYCIKVNQNTQLDLFGALVATPFDIPLSTGWNIMGYPTQDTANAITVLQPLIDSSYLTKVIDEAGEFIQEIPGAGWLNTIGNFEPGEGYYIKVNQNCALTIGREAPTVTTDNATGITHSTATSGGNITYDGGAPVTARGVCWSTSSNPTLANSYTTDGSGTGTFVSNITWLTVNTQYYVRAYATNVEGTSYGNEITFTTSPPTMATVTTNSVTNITATTATSGGNVTSNGGSPVTARGVCWSTSSSPTLADSYTTDGMGMGAFFSNLTGLTLDLTYYVRAYATNNVGTAYGNEISFMTVFTWQCGDTIVDMRDGQIYNTVLIGTQCWMAENLNFNMSGAYWYNSSSSNGNIYGRLYYWNASLIACPSGWHLPMDTEWTMLIDYLGGASVAGGNMKETGTNHWNSPNTGASNNSGFTALPGGMFWDYSSYSYLGNKGLWWSSSEVSGSGINLSINYDAASANITSSSKWLGFSIRCVKD